MRPVKRRHPPDDAKGAHQYKQYLTANDPRYRWHDGMLKPEPGFPVEVLPRG